MSRSPNAEQKLAIEHQGGVLLRAGAGSGKTFVLVEHIIYLTRHWIQEYKKSLSGTFEEYIRQKFSEVVMMTFTKKAAGEMSIRLAEKFEEITLASEEDKDYWSIANDSLPLLMVTTIDGFCRKLITAGYFPHLSTEAKIIFVPERKDQVRDLLDHWLAKASEHTSQDVLDIVVREKEALLTAFCNIFNDPGLRLSWKHFKLTDADAHHLGGVIQASYKLNNIESQLQILHSLQLPVEGQSAFEKAMADLQSTGLPSVRDVEQLAIYAQFFSGKRLLPESTARKKCAEYTAAHEARKILREWVQNWHEPIQLFQQNFETKVKPWIQLCYDVFQWIDLHLDPNQGLTFGDIEYLVALGLENDQDRQRIQKSFRYFIVDEFQDTSALQFKIIQSLIGKDYSRLFCVGDAKQAIYGFRGGELSVFTDCAELVPQVLSLANNYRSLPTVINFNNSLFKTVLPLGQGFEGVDAFTVEFEDQHVPAEVSHITPGSVEVLTVELDRDLEIEEKFRNEEVNRIESYLIVDSIAKKREEFPNEVCTVLYSKLKPSSELIRFLMDRKIGFTAQFKTDLLDDPIIGIFLILLRRQFDRSLETKDRYPLYMIQSYLQVLNLTNNVTVDNLNQFDQDAKYWGLVEAYRKFIHHMGITNENADLNLKVIDTINLLFHQDQESVMNQLARGDNDRISLDLRWGENSHMVQIMTAHASKGLEFDTVYLAGIYTNGRENSDSSLFGDRPGSFKWYLDLAQRDKRESPFYIYETELSRYKSFSESKRLFYVACTRAKKRLFWINLELPEKSFSIPGNSWVDGLNYWMQNQSEQIAIIERKQDFDYRALLISESRPQLPLFFHDPVGIFPKEGGASELALAAELSVTRLNSLVDCPRKFYLQNILKLKEEKIQPLYKEEVDLEEIVVKPSSAERGTYIHAQIAEGIEHNFVVPRESFSGAQREPIQWALDQLKVLADDYELIAEKALKFKFFNFMISGIPDLLLIPKSNQIAQVWDFKTGKINKENLAHYWVQLKAYAYGLYQLQRVPYSSEIELKLIFVDQKQVLSETVNFERTQYDLYPLWQSQNQPWKINPEHCSQCPYGDICPR